MDFELFCKILDQILCNKPRRVYSSDSNVVCKTTWERIFKIKGMIDPSP